MNTQWLKWARELQAISQTGLTYSENQYDIERFQQIQSLAAEMTAHHSCHTHKAVHKLFENEYGYATPKIDVRGVIFENEKILLVREIEDGRWTLPGGWADVNLSAAENVVKEVREESGFWVEVVRLLAVYDRDKHGHTPALFHQLYKMFFLCEIIGGEASHSMETNGVAFFDLNQLPDLSIQRITKEQIFRMAELRYQKAADFD